MASLTLSGNSLVLKCSYNPGLVAEIKSRIPYTERKYNPADKSWVVSPNHGQLLSNLIAQYLGEMVTIPAVKTSKPVPEMRLLEIRYLGITKPREGFDQRVAFGYCNNDWGVIFTEQVLINWFTGMSSSSGDSATTLYGILCISRAATPDEVKTAFRRLAKQWHPDYCREPNAGEKFMQIKNAYDLLNDPNKRARYDAGLALEASLANRSTPVDNYQGYRAPLRCGYVLAEGVETIGRFLVSNILAWEDITNNLNQTLVVSWPAGADRFCENWV